MIPTPPREDVIARRVIERIAEDETLHGKLTDDAFKPIVDWVTSLVPAAAQRAALDPDPIEATEQLSQTTRQLIRALVQVVSNGDASSLASQFGPPLFTADEADRLRTAVPSEPLSDRSPVERSLVLIDALSAALSAK